MKDPNPKTALGLAEQIAPILAGVEILDAPDTKKEAAKGIA